VLWVEMGCVGRAAAAEPVDAVGAGTWEGAERHLGARRSVGRVQGDGQQQGLPAATPR